MVDDFDYSRPRNNSSFEDCGYSMGRGRGCAPHISDKKNKDSPGRSSTGYGSYQNSSDTWDDSSKSNIDNNNYKSQKSPSYNSEHDDRSKSGTGYKPRNNDNGGYKPRGGGGGGKDRDYNEDDNDHGYKPRGGGGGDRGGRGGFNRDRDNNNDEDGGYKPRGSGGGFKGRRNDDENGEEKERPPPYIPPDEPTDEETLFGSSVEIGINFDKYDNIQIQMSGENEPPPILSFDAANLRPLLLENIKKSGYKKPTPVQKYAIPIIMNGRDLMACAQTGSGKTAAFVVPIIHTLLEHPTDLITTGQGCQPQAIIVSPTRELAIQIAQQVGKFALGSIIKHVVAYGGTSVMHQGGRVSSGCHILVATPGRLLDFVERGRVSFASVRFFVLDEADRMLDMGFLPDIEKMVDHDTMVPKDQRQTLMFSATFPEDIQRLAQRFLNNYLFLAVGIVGGACSDVEQTFHKIEKRSQKVDTLKEIMRKERDLANGKMERTLVFVEKQRTADFIAALLSESDFPTTSIHGARLQREREEALMDFKTGRMTTLVATAVAARGLDIKNVAHVINYDMPQTVDEYVHRIGRTGRVGNRGKATSLFDPEKDSPLTGDLVKILKQADQEIPTWLECGEINRGFSAGRSNFGGRDVRKFDDDAEATYSAPAAAPVEVTEFW